MENHDYSAIVGSSAAPYENQIANACGLATNYHAISAPVVAELHRHDQRLNARHHR